MENIVANQEKLLLKRILTREKELLRQLYNYSISGELAENDIEKAKSAVTNYFYQFLIENTQTNIAINSLSRILRALLKTPIIHKIDTSQTKKIYNYYHIINETTFLIYQLSDRILNTVIINRFMSYIKGSSIENLCVFFLYRLNPDYISENYRIKTLDNLSPEELYFGIATGYYSMKHGTNQAFIRLLELTESKDETVRNNAMFFVEKIKKEGFYIK